MKKKGGKRGKREWLKKGGGWKKERRKGTGRG